MSLKIKITGILFACSLGVLTFKPALAQEKKQGWGETNKLEDAEIIVEKNRVNELPEANRNFEKFKIEPPEKKPKQVVYRFADYKLADLKLNLPMRVLTIKQEDLTKLYGNYVKLGYGNYNTPYLKGYFHNKRDNQYSYGADLSHVSSGKGPVAHSGVSNSAFNLNGESYNGDITTGGKVSYGRDAYHFYGYSPVLENVQADTIKQHFNRLGASVFANNKLGKGPLAVEAGLGFDFFNNRYQAKETNVALNLGTAYNIKDGATINVNSDLSFITYKDSNPFVLSGSPEVKRNRTYFRLAPAFVKTTDKLNVTFGANLGYTNDTIKAARKFNIYPNVRVAYELADDQFQVFAGVTGDLERVTLNRLTQENPFLNQNVNIADANKIFDFFGGLTGNLNKNLKFTGKVAYQSFRNLYFFNNSPSDSSKFDVIYDNGTTGIINFSGDLTYNQSEKFRLGIKADYNQYTTDELAQPYHRPAMQANLYSSYNLYDKIFIHSELYYISRTFGNVTRVRRSDGSVKTALKETDTIVDLNLKVDYRFSDKFSTFVMANNMLGKEYQRFVNYPNKGLQAIVGISYIF